MDYYFWDSVAIGSACLLLLRTVGKSNNKLIYTHLVTFESDEFHVKTASTLKEACELAEAGFDYFTTIDDVQIFRKRK